MYLYPTKKVTIKDLGGNDVTIDIKATLSAYDDEEMQKTYLQFSEKDIEIKSSVSEKGTENKQKKPINFKIPREKMFEIYDKIVDILVVGWDREEKFDAKKAKMMIAKDQWEILIKECDKIAYPIRNKEDKKKLSKTLL